MLLVLGLSIAMGWLIQRALGGLQIQREAQNRAVAERVFDEMERALSDFLQTEDERSYRQYSFYYTPDGAPSDVRVLSPLAGEPGSPFVVGYFQLEPDGQVRTPLLPEDRAGAEAAGDFVLSLDREVRAARVLEVASALILGNGGEEARFPALSISQAPGTTRKLGASGGFVRQRASGIDDATSDAYEVLQQLNRGARDRADRLKKVEPESGRFDLESKASTVEEGLASEADALVVGDAQVSRTPQSVAVAQARDRLEALPGARQRLARLPARVTVDPFLGREGPDGLFVLLRTVIVDERGIRQGIVLELDELIRSLRDRSLVEGAFEGDAIELAFAADVIGTDRPQYRHRFGEPFDTLTIDLVLAPLGDVAGGSAVAVLSALSLGVMGLALFALYRMVAVTVAFAERRSNFVAAVSHELKTPLTAIRMYGEMLRDGLVPNEEKQQEYYRSITAESERLSRLINNVLEFSRLERGAREVDLRVGDVTPVLREAIELLGPNAEQRGHPLSLEVSGELPAVAFERDALLQVLFNLVDNSLKYAADAEQRGIEVSAKRQGRGVRITVRDHGPGISAEHASHILEPFYRGETELTRRTQGTGIGLALVDGLVREMDASIELGNADGGGFFAAVEIGVS